MYHEDRYEAVKPAEELINDNDENLKKHAQFCVAQGRGYMKFAFFDTEGSYKGASLWVHENSTFTVKPEYLNSNIDR